MTFPSPLREDALTLQAPAKINLTLDVFSKREDGYHSLASVMQTVSLYDTLTFSRTETGPQLKTNSAPSVQFTCEAPHAPDVPGDETNLVVKAAKAVLKAADSREAIRIHLQKQIPSQAGLGGGSSDAASALIGTNRLLGSPLAQKPLLALAASLGSDVPFFLVGGAATARGRGEQLTPLPDLPPLWVVIVKPAESVSTGWAYGQLDALPERASHRGTKRLEEAIRTQDWERLIAFQSNDFERVVFEAFPKIAWLHDELRMAGAVTAHLCGSGSAVYGVAANAQDAHRIAERMSGRYPQVVAARTLPRPLSPAATAPVETSEAHP